MGIFGRWSGKGGSGRDEPPRQFSRHHWSSDSLDVRTATTEQFLQLVALAAKLEDVDLALRPEEECIELRASRQGFPLCLSVSFDGRMSWLGIQVRSWNPPVGELPDRPTLFEVFAIRYEPEPSEDDEPKARHNRIALGEHVYVERWDQDAAPVAFSVMPATLRARIARDLPRLRIRKVLSQDVKLEVSFREDPRDIEDAVQRLVEAISLAVDIQIALGLRAPPPHLRGYAAGIVYEWADRIAQAIGSSVPGATVSEREEDSCVDVTWLEGSIGVQITCNHDTDELHVIAYVPGVDWTCELRSARIVAEDDGRVRLAPRVLIDGDADEAQASSRLLRSLPPAIFTDFERGFDDLFYAVELDDELLRTQPFAVSEISDHGETAVRIAKLLARVGQALAGG